MNSKNVKMQILGSGCPNCNKLLELTRQAVWEMKIDAEIAYITDINQMIAMGIMSTPALAINNRPVVSGRVPDLEDLKKIITENV